MDEFPVDHPAAELGMLPSPLATPCPSRWLLMLLHGVVHTTTGELLGSG